MDPMNLDSFHQSLKKSPKKENTEKSPRRSASPVRSRPTSPKKCNLAARSPTTPATTATPTPTATRASSPSQMTTSMPTSKLAVTGTAAEKGTELRATPEPSPPLSPGRMPGSRAISRGREPRKEMDRCPRCGAKEFMAACVTCGYGTGVGM